MKNIIRLIERIEMDASGDSSSAAADCIYAAVDENFNNFRKELGRAAPIVMDFAEILAAAAKGNFDGYIPEAIADELSFQDTSFLKKIYSALDDYGGGHWHEDEIIDAATDAAKELHDIGDKYFPEEELMNITDGNDDLVYGECYPEFWRYLLAGLVDDQEKKVM